MSGGSLGRRALFCLPRILEWLHPEQALCSSACTSVPEGCGWLADDDGEWPVGLVAFGPDGDPEALAPGAFGQLLDFLLAAVEGGLTLFGLQQEAPEIADVVSAEAGDLPG